MGAEIKEWIWQMFEKRLQKERLNAQAQTLELIYRAAPRGDRTEAELIAILNKIK